MTTDYPLHLVHDNPWQTRPLDSEHVQRLAASIEKDSLLEPPLGRPHPSIPGAVELAFGHHRKAAVLLLKMRFDGDQANKGKPNPRATIPVEVRAISDRDMARYAIIENHHRSDPSAIEKARALLRLTTDAAIKMSQTEAGALFELGQAAVSKLVHLLDLPPAVQDLVDQGELAEVPARALCTLLEWQAPNDPDYGRKMVSQIAAQAIKDHPSDQGRRAQRVEVLIDEALRRGEASPLSNDYYRPWPMEWPGKPLPVPQGLMFKTRTAPAEVPACTGCPWNLKRGDLRYCLRPACYDVKHTLWAEHQVELAAARLGIAAAAPGETIHIVWEGGHDYDRRREAQKLVTSKHADLRLAPRKRASHGGYEGSDYGLDDLLGSKAVMLATTNPAAIERFVGSAKSTKAAVVRTANETPAQAERRINAEKELREEKALERMAYNRSRADVLWIVEHTAGLIGQSTVAAGGVLLLVNHLAYRYFNIGLDEMRAAKEALDKRAQAKLHKFERTLEGWSAQDVVPAEVEQCRRQLVAYIVLASEIGGYQKPTDVYGNFKEARDGAEKVATRWFGVELPAGWDTPPVHHTPLNCWTCGRFSAAGAGKLTQGDAKEGWRSLYANKAGQVASQVVGGDAPGAVLQGVWCPQHAAAGMAEWNRANLKAKAQAEDAELAEQTKTRMVRAVGPQGKTIMVRAEADGVDPLVLGEIVGTQYDHARVWVGKANLATLRAALPKVSAVGHTTMIYLDIEKRIKKLESAQAKPAKRPTLPGKLLPSKVVAVLTRSNAKAAAAAAASARELAAKVKGKDGRGHTRPAPKPGHVARVSGKKGGRNPRGKPGAGGKVARKGGK